MSAVVNQPDPGGLAERIDALLPQTQCGRCGYERCRPYAEALAQGTAALNRCPPGGAATIEALSALLGRPPLQPDPACGVPGAFAVAVIDESECIGCTLCIQACPVDAIVGVARRMHTVVASLCSGCDRCVAPCPVDCISMQPPDPPRAWSADDAQAARRRMLARDQRLQAQRLASEARQASRRHDEAAPQIEIRGEPPQATRPGIAALVGQAVARARLRRAAGPR